MTDFQVRAAEESDTALILDSWLMSYSKHCKDVAWDVYRPQQLRVIDELARGDSLLVAFSPLDRDLVLGWIAFDAIIHPNPRLILDYLYVKGSFKDQGIDTLLLDTALRLTGVKVVITTHLVRGGCTFDPYQKFRRRTSASKENT